LKTVFPVVIVFQKGVTLTPSFPNKGKGVFLVLGGHCILSRISCPEEVRRLGSVEKII